MDIHSNSVIGKIIKDGGQTGQVTGYLHVEKKDAKTFRVYPELSASPYFEVETRDVIDIVGDGRGEDKQTVILKGDARVKFCTCTELSGSDLGPGGDPGWVSTRFKLPPWADRLSDLIGIGNAAFLERYLGTESIPGTGQTGRPGDDL